MNKSQLYIYNVPVPVEEELQVNISKLIADIREPDKRNTDFSNTVSIPGCAEIDKIFEFCFELSIDLQTFNPNLKTPVSYRINNTEVISGWLKVTRIIRIFDKKQHIYQCEIKGHFSDLFYKMGDLFLTDLSFSEYTHELNKVNVMNSWVTSNYVSGSPTALVAGLGYRYALADYGANAGHLSDFPVNGMRPILFAYEYLLKIFSAAGKTFASTFLSSAFFKKLAILPTEIIKASDTDLALRNYYVGEAGAFQTWNQSLTPSNVNPTYYWSSPQVDHLIVFNTNSTAPFHDVGANYNTSSGVFGIYKENDYSIEINVYLSMRLNTPAIGQTPSNHDKYCIVVLQQYISGVWTPVSDSQTISDTNVSGSTFSLDTMFTIKHSGHFLPTDTFRIVLSVRVNNLQIAVAGGGGLVHTGTASYDIYNIAYNVTTITNSTMSVTSDTGIKETDTMDLNNSVPVNIKQKDFFKGLINMFNLYVDIDKDNPNNYIIEPEPTFFRNTYRDWSTKIDISQPVIEDLIAGGDMKGMKLKYKDDGDYYNKDYQDQFSEPYGTLVTESESQFNTDVKEIQLPFSPTPLVGNDTNNLLIPKVYKNSNGVVTQQRANIRIAFWNPAMVNIGPTSWTLKSVSGDSVLMYYPYIGHFDDPASPTFDLSFDVPFKVYFKINIYPTTNLWTTYYKTWFNRLTDKNSKRITAQFALNELDIKAFDFRDLVFVLGMYMRVNAINNFNVLENKTTEVELLKI